VLAFTCNVQKKKSLSDDLIHSAWTTSHPVRAAKLVNQLAVCGVTGRPSTLTESRPLPRVTSKSVRRDLAVWSVVRKE
jgi:hypothetical protein